MPAMLPEEKTTTHRIIDVIIVSDIMVLHGFTVYYHEILPEAIHPHPSTKPSPERPNEGHRRSPSPGTAAAADAVHITIDLQQRFGSPRTP